MAKRKGGHVATFSNMTDFRRFALAGNAVFTMVSKRTGERFTYRIRKPRAEPGEPEKPFFIQLMNGPDNTTSYGYLGLIFGKGEDTDFRSYRYGGHKAVAKQSAPSVQGLEWLIRNVMCEKVLDRVELWHQGKCGACRRPLTVPESIASGLGPVCAKGGRD